MQFINQLGLNRIPEASSPPNVDPDHSNMDLDPEILPAASPDIENADEFHVDIPMEENQPNPPMEENQPNLPTDENQPDPPTEENRPINFFRPWEDNEDDQHNIEQVQQAALVEMPQAVNVAVVDELPGPDTQNAIQSLVDLHCRSPQYTYERGLRIPILSNGMIFNVPIEDSIDERELSRISRHNPLMSRKKVKDVSNMVVLSFIQNSLRSRRCRAQKFIELTNIPKNDGCE
jgi:hypothetical protein